MDPLSVTASINAVLPLSAEVIMYLHDAKEVSAECNQILVEICSVTGILTGLKDLVERSRSDETWLATTRSLEVPEGPLAQFKLALEPLAKELAPIYGLKKAGEALKWPFKKEGITKIINSIELQKTLFILALQNDSTKLSKAIKDNMVHLQGEVKEVVKGVKEMDKGIRLLHLAQDHLQVNINNKLEDAEHVPHIRKTTPSRTRGFAPNGPCKDGPVDPSFVFRRPSNPTASNMKAYRRQLLRQIHKKPTTETMLKQALAVYDIENGYDALSDDVLSGLERVFGLEGVQWPSVRERMYMLLSKVSNSLKRLLRTYGYGHFATYGENHKGRLRIMPAPGCPPPALPEWLQIPYLVPVEGVEFRIIYDRCIIQVPSRQTSAESHPAQRPLSP